MATCVVIETISITRRSFTPLSRHRLCISLPPTTLTRDQLVDKFDSLFPETPNKAFHRERRWQVQELLPSVISLGASQASTMSSLNHHSSRCLTGSVVGMINWELQEQQQQRFVNEFRTSEWHGYPPAGRTDVCGGITTCVLIDWWRLLHTHAVPSCCYLPGAFLHGWGAGFVFTYVLLLATTGGGHVSFIVVRAHRLPNNTGSTSCNQP